MGEYCPFIASCPFYQNYIEQTKSKRVDVIMERIPLPLYPADIRFYNCLPLIKLRKDMFLVQDDKKIKIGNKLRGKLRKPKERNFSCSHITLLNRLRSLGK